MSAAAATVFQNEIKPFRVRDDERQWSGGFYRRASSAPDKRVVIEAPKCVAFVAETKKSMGSHSEILSNKAIPEHPCMESHFV